MEGARRDGGGRRGDGAHGGRRRLGPRRVRNLGAVEAGAELDGVRWMEGGEEGIMRKEKVREEKKEK